MTLKFLPSYLDPPTSGFKVFKGNEQNILEGLSPREHLDVAAKYGESHVVELTSSSQAAVSQQGANINLDCLLWRNGSSQLQNGTIQWKFIQLDQFGKPRKPICLIVTLLLRRA